MYYGKLNQNGSFLQHPCGYMQVSIGCQMEILLLIEMLEESGIKVISGNTDGVVSLYHSYQKDVYERVCNKWQEIVGNTDLGRLEFTSFQKLWQESVNHYIALKDDGKVKKKGRFATEFELNKNKSKLIIPLALEAYFIKGISPIEFIPKHNNIFDFTIAKKAYGNMHYEEIIDTGDRHHPDIRIHKKLVRYYICKNGSVLMKRGKDVNNDDVNDHCEAIDSEFFWMGQPKVRYFNTYEEKKISDYDIDYPYYILQTLKRIDKIEKTDKAKRYANQFKITQISMF